MTDMQRKNMETIHMSCVLQAAVIAVVFAGAPCAVEMWTIYEFDTDGVVDAYWMCPQTFGDPTAPPWGVGNLTLENCDPFTTGYCNSIPNMTASEYLAMGGNTAMGGSWTDDDITDGDCTPLKMTWSYESALP
eukprot:SAG11_NODE_508_length_8874_cov_5.205812_5_plen_133_part_00